MTLESYLEQLQKSAATVSAALAERIDVLGRERLLEHPHGDMARWQAAVNSLPAVTAHLDATRATVSLTSQQAADIEAIETSLKGLMPWRKGPFDFFGVSIDCEWRSDWKWQRVAPHLAPLTGRRVLDVGCGSGYHAWRMWGAGASYVLGIDPGMLFLNQFLAAKRYAPAAPVWFAPLRMEELPNKLEAFDTVFSMGVLYHRRDPLQHIAELADCLEAGGQLVIETLVVEGDECTVLMPEGRYAAMRNVWFLPSVAMLSRWLTRCGFREVRCVDVNQTSCNEQRATDWMCFQSLSDFLDPDNNNLTREGYTAPRRAVLVATK